MTDEEAREFLKAANKGAHIIELKTQAGNVTFVQSMVAIKAIKAAGDATRQAAEKEPGANG